MIFISFDTKSNRKLSPKLTESSHSSNLLHIMINTRTRNHGGRMDFHGGSVTGATAEKLSEVPRFHKRYCKGLMTMETALEMETWNHEDHTCLTLMDGLTNITRPTRKLRLEI
ncbi:unnamed protein product [Brassica oleracea var. botrytis]